MKKGLCFIAVFLLLGGYAFADCTFDGSSDDYRQIHCTTNLINSITNTATQTLGAQYTHFGVVGIPSNASSAAITLTLQGALKNASGVLVDSWGDMTDTHTMIPGNANTLKFDVADRVADFVRVHLISNAALGSEWYFSIALPEKGQ